MAGLGSASQLPFKDATAPGLHARAAVASVGSPEVTSMVTYVEEDWPAGLVAVNVTLYLPAWAAAGVHSKPPLVASKVAPTGRSDAVSWTGRSDGSAANTVNRAGAPRLAALLFGAKMTGWKAAATWIVS